MAENVERTQTTVYLSKEDREKINKLIYFQYSIGVKTTMSDVISEAIDFLHKDKITEL